MFWHAENMVPEQLRLQVVGAAFANMMKCRQVRYYARRWQMSQQASQACRLEYEQDAKRCPKRNSQPCATCSKGASAELPVPVIRVRFPAPSLSGMLPWRWLLPTSMSSRFGNTFTLLLFCNLHMH